MQIIGVVSKTVVSIALPAQAHVSGKCCLFSVIASYVYFMANTDNNIHTPFTKQLNELNIFFNINTRQHFQREANVQPSFNIYDCLYS